MPHASSEFVAFPSRSDLLRTPRLILECISPPQFHSMRVDSRVLKGTANPNDQGVDDDAHQGIYEVFPHSVALLTEAARTQHNHAYYDHSVYCFIEMYDTWRAFVKSTLSSAQGNATHVVLTMLTVREFFDGVLFLHLAIGSVLHSAGEDLQALRHILTCVDLLVFFGSSFLTSSYPCDSEYFCAHQYEKQKSTFVTRCEVLIEKEYRNQIPASEQEEWTFLKSACDLDTDTIQELMDSIENESNLISPETYEWCSTAGTAHSRAQSQNPERAPRKIRCIQEDIPNKRHQFFLAHAYSWLGILYFRLSMFDYALDYFHRCLEIREYHLIHSALEHRRSCVTCRLGIIQVLNNIAVALSMLSKHDGDALDSIRLLERAESMCADHAAHSLPARTDETRPIQDIAQDPFCSTTMLSSIPVRARIIAQNLRILRRLCTVALPQRLLDGATRSSGGTSSHSMGTLGSAENLKWSGVQSVLMGRGEHVPLIPGAKLSIRQANASQSKAGAKKKTKKKK